MKIVLAFVAGALGIGLNVSAIAQDRQANAGQTTRFSHKTDAKLRSGVSSKRTVDDFNRTQAATAQVVSIAADAAATPPPTTLPLNNADFETPPFGIVGTVTGWTIGGTANVGDINQGATSGSNSAALSAGGNSEGDMLSQRFFSTAGRSYNLDFDAAIYGEPDSGSPLQQLTTQVVGDSSLLDVTLTDLATANNFVQSDVPWKHYHFVFTADSAVTTLQFTDIGLGNSLADVVLDTVSIEPIPPSFAEWQIMHFDEAERGNPGISGWNADPDMDGIPNGLEYFFQTDPKAGIPYAERDFLPQVSFEIDGSSKYLIFTYRRLIDWTGNPEVIAVSDDLLTWDETQSQVEQVGDPVRMGDAFTEIVKVRLKTPVNQGPILRKFFRVELTQ